MESWLELYSSSSLFQTISLGFVLDEPFFGPEFCKRLLWYLFTALNRNKIRPSNKGLNKNPRLV